MTDGAPAVVFSASLAGRPRAGGHAWVVRTWVSAFRRRGCQVLIVDHGDRATAAGGWPVVEQVAACAGVDAAMLLDDGDALGLPRAQVLRRLATADVLVDMMGFLGDAEPEAVAGSSLPVFLDVDPGIGQQWAADGLHDPYPFYQRHVTVGGLVGHPGCAVPTAGLDWIPVLPPVLLDEWSVQSTDGRAVTTVGVWRGPWGPYEVDGVRHGQRAHEFRRYLDLPRRCPLPLEVALAFDSWDDADRAALQTAGWRLLDPIEVAPTMDMYRNFVQRSAAELCIARESYVRSQCGWFSDRSATYLASGRPVVACDTGFSDLLPTGAGLFAVHGPDDAASALQEIHRDPRRHAHAARDIAGAYLEAGVVVGGLLQRLSAPAPLATI